MDIPRIICNKKQSHQAIQKQPICIAYADYDYNIDKIERCDNIEFERQIHNDDRSEFYMSTCML